MPPKGRRKHKKGQRGDVSSDEGDKVPAPAVAADVAARGRGKKGRGQGGKRGKGKAREGGFFFLELDPRRIRFAHSRIRPVFSGCGRRLEDTLEEIRSGLTAISDLPVITVIVGPKDEITGEAWYFSTNNRRLWVMKRCREEGLLDAVRVRARHIKAHEEAWHLIFSLFLSPNVPHHPSASSYARDVTHWRVALSRRSLCSGLTL
ncbi:unnamed protein product, partial [Chrysoparadoxa australica]